MQKLLRSLFEEWNIKFEEAGRLLNQAAVFCHERGQYADAEPLFKRSLVIREKELGPNHPEVATSLNNLAELYRIQGKYTEAELLYKRSLDIREKTLRADH